MSSAALQTAPHQPPPQSALASPPLPASSSGRQNNNSAHSSPTWEAYHGQRTQHHQQQQQQQQQQQHHHQQQQQHHHQHSNSQSSSSRRPPSRKTSGHGVSPPPDLTAAIAARTAAASASSATASPHSPKSDRFTMPPVAPPRTSSNQQSSSSRRAANYSTDKPSNSPRQAHPEASSSRPGEYRPATNGSAPNGSHAKRVSSSHGQAHDSPARSTHSRDGSRATAGATTTMPIRTHQGESAGQQPREGGDGLMRAMTTGDEPNGREERSHRHASSHAREAEAAPPPPVKTSANHEEKRSSRQEHSGRSHHRSKFGDFILTRTLGEGEFGKVKAGWKPGSSVEVAIKLIKRDAVGSNPVRLAKIKREVTILRGLKHPNIVKLLDMVETDRYIGIVLECASGGELFQYIADQGKGLDEYLARRMFAQLVSGVGYLHKNGIIHRDLKLENLLLDSKGNIIITDFGFANIFDPSVELTEEEEFKLQDHSFVKRLGLDKVNDRGMRKGDLMQTSCGSPCYAAPELVTDDVPLYTGRKADVWSCGVILYAMLAGYLPFDDDPDNADGSNIQQLYLYINRTPLTFPETITPHARDLLRRILVPNPRKRADLFEVARHSWLSEYSHVVEFITSTTTSPDDIQNATAAPETFASSPVMARSSSVRESKRKQNQSPPIGGLTKTQNKIDTPPEAAQRAAKDAKRRTVQVEYVAPTTQTQRGSDPVQPERSSRSREQQKPLPTDPPTSRDAYSRSGQQRAPPVSHNATKAPRDERGNNYTTAPSGARPQTGGSMQSTGSAGLQSRVNYGQPAPPTVADTNAQGRIQQPTSLDDSALVGRPTVTVPLKFAKVSGFHDDDKPAEAKLGGQFRGHKRSSTIGDISSKLLGRSGSVFGRKNKKPEPQVEKPSRKYPPVSLANNGAAGQEPGRASMDSHMSGGRRSFSLGLGKKRSGSISDSVTSTEKKERRRFSLLPASFSLKAIGLGKDQDTPSPMSSQQNMPSYDGRKDQIRNFTAPTDARGTTPFFDNPQDGASGYDTNNSSPVYNHQRYKSAQMERSGGSAIPSYISRHPNHLNSGSETSMDLRRPPTEPQMGTHSRAFADAGEYDTRRVGTSGTGRSNRGVLQKNKRFVDAYEQGHDGSTAPARRVMDFFRRRGKTRSGEDR